MDWMDTESFLKNICGSLFETTVELRHKWFEDKTNYSFYANCDLTMQAYVCEL